MPSGNQCQTRKINSIYYAIDDPLLPKSHDSGNDAQVGVIDPAGLFLMQGPLAINWRAPDHPRIENASLTTRNWGRPDRIRKWIDCNIHVRGKEDWLFVKLHTHGALERDHSGLFGDKAFEMYRTLSEQYNDGRKYSLHFVTARQAYNIAKAAEHGKTGCPSEWVDFVHPPQPHHYYTINAAHQLVGCTPSKLIIHNIDASVVSALRTRVGPVSRINGALSSIEIDEKLAILKIGSHNRERLIELVMNPTMEISEIRGATILATQAKGAKYMQIRACSDRIKVAFRLA